MDEYCPKCHYPSPHDGGHYKGLYQPECPCPHCGYEALGVEPGVSDLGRHRKLTEKTKEGIREAFMSIYESMKGAPQEHLVLFLARQAIGYLELPKRALDDWYERPPPPTIGEEVDISPELKARLQRMWPPGRSKG